MIILYVLLVAYILAVNFYAFLLVKSLRDKETQEELRKQAEPLISESSSPTNERFLERPLSKLFLTAILGGAITIYVSMFIFKYKRNDILLMIILPLLGVLNVYIFVLLFRSGFSFFIFLFFLFLN